jgi:hypothetical protein
MLEDQCTKDEQVIRDLRNEAADRADELLTMQRKWFASRAGSGGLSPLAPALSGGGLLRAGASCDVGKAAGAAAAAASADASAEAAEARALLEKRTAELDAEREATLRVQRCALRALPC